MKTKTKFLLTCLVAFTALSHANAGAEKETRYLAFQIFTYGPNLLTPAMGEGPHPQPARFPDKAALRHYIEDIKGRIGAVGDPQTRLAVILGLISFDHADAEVTKFIELWSKGLAEAGVSPQKIYSHTCFLSRRAFGGDDKDITYMKRKGGITYSQHNHFAPPSVAFGKSHRPGFSTYPQGGLFEDIYEQLDKHKQVGWASCEGTNMQPASGPGQTGMNMETYLAKMFNHGATLCNVQSWGVGGEANKNMGFRVVTEGEEALQAYRKFLRGEPLVEGETVASLTDRLPPKIHQIQKQLPAWIQKTGNQEAAALMQKMQEQMKAKDFTEVEKTADSILKMMGVSAQSAAPGGENKPQLTPTSDDLMKRLTEKFQRVMHGVQKWMASGRDTSAIHRTMEEKFRPLIEAGKVSEAEGELDRVLDQFKQDAK